MEHSVSEADFADGETDAQRGRNDSFKAAQRFVAEPGPETVSQPSLARTRVLRDDDGMEHRGHGP